MIFHVGMFSHFSWPKYDQLIVFMDINIGMENTWKYNMCRSFSSRNHGCSTFFLCVCVCVRWSDGIMNEHVDYKAIQYYTDHINLVCNPCN